MSDRVSDGCFPVFGLVMAAVLLVFISYNLGKVAVRQDAIEAGVAEWTVDPKTGTTEFRWRGEAP